MDNTLKKRLSTRSALDIIFIVLMLMALVLSVWKLPYGLGGWDEAFYLDVPYRLVQGDALFKDEWHVSQISAVLLTPIVWLCTKILGGTEGLMMAARWTYLILHLAVSVFIYIRMRRYGLAAVFSSLLYFLFVPLSIMALSYNSIGLALVILTGLILSDCSYEKKFPIILSGFLFAGAVLCNPFLLLAYMALFVCTVIHSILKKKCRENAFFGGGYFSFKAFLFFTLGAALMALIFFAYLFSKICIKDILINIPYILNDPEHVRMSLISIIPNYFKYIIMSSKVFGLSFILYIILLVSLFFDKRRRQHKPAYFAAACFCVILGLLGFSHGLIENDLYNNIMFPFVYLGSVCFILSEEKDYRLFACLFCLGLAYSFAMFLSSNQYMVVISMAVCASNIAGAAFVWQFMHELKAEYGGKATPFKAVCLALFAAICLQAVLQTLVAVKHVYWEEEPAKLNTQISGGPADGIYTNPETAGRYQAFLSDIQGHLGVADGEKVLFLSPDTIFYLMAGNMRCATFSAWTSGEDYHVLEKMMLYYDVNPGNIPQHVYIPKETSYYKYIDEITAEYALLGFSSVETEMATIMSRVN